MQIICNFRYCNYCKAPLKILSSPWIRPSSLVSKILMGFCSDGPCECTGRIWSRWFWYQSKGRMRLPWSNLAPFRRYCRFFCAPEWPHRYFTPILVVFPLHQMAHVGVSPSRALRLFGREIIFEVFQPVWKHTSTSRTDRRTDGQLTVA